MTLDTFVAQLLLAFASSSHRFDVATDGVSSSSPNTDPDAIRERAELVVRRPGASSAVVVVRLAAWVDSFDGLDRLLVVLRIDGRFVTDWELAHGDAGSARLTADQVERVSRAVVALCERAWLEAELRDAAAAELWALARHGVVVEHRLSPRRARGVSL